MLIVSSSKWKIEEVLSLASKGGWALTALLCFLFVVLTAISVEEGKKVVNTLREKTPVSKPFVVPLEKIGQGPLSLHSRKKKTILPDMSQEVALLAKNIRPGRDAKEGSFLLLLKSSHSERRIRNGETVFLACDPSPGGSLLYRFSDKKTPLWIRPNFLEKDKIFLEVGLFMPSKESEVFVEEKGQFVLQEEPFDWSEKFQNIVWLESLKTAKLWGPDLFLSKYGGDVFKELKNKFKIEILGEHVATFCFVGLGDFLIWDEGKWAPIERLALTGDKPLAHVKAISPRSMELEVWDSDGFYPQLIKLEMQSISRTVAVRPDQLPQSMRMRTTNQVSCSLGKRRCLLKPGDWVLKTARGWRSIKMPSDREDYLRHKIRGDLCVFDSLSREQGKLVMKGHWFDEMRTQVHSFAIPVEGDQQAKNQARRAKKNLVLKKMEGSSITYLPSPIKTKKESEGDHLE